MTNLASQRESDKREKIDQSNEVSDKDNNISSSGKSDIIGLTIFSIIMMGILIFLFQ